ncbi:MAG: prolyl oligopeptidase family serine peptidase [Gemmatimonadaceae bacterium]
MYGHRSPLARFLGAAALVAACVSTPLATPTAQSSSQAATAPTAFTIDDALDVVTYQVGDLSDDGRWLAATSAPRRNQIGIDYNRSFGDPTYIPPTSMRVSVIDTRTGDTRAVFPDGRNVRSLAWSPDARHLALLVVSPSGVLEPRIWERETGRLTAVPVPAGKYVAENSDVRWTRDGRSVVFALRTDAWRRKTREEFERLTTGPVIVQASTDPFLAWDGLRRLSLVRSVVAYDLAARRVRELLPERMVATYAVTEDGSSLVFSEDITKKTDYDVIFGREDKLVVRSLASGDTARVVMPTLKGVTLVWARDGRRFAYAKDGKLYVGSIADTARRQVAGDTARPGAPADTSKEARDRQARERFTPVRFSPAGDAIVASNRQGLWVLDLASKARDLIIETSDSLAQSPRASAIGWSEDGRYVYLSYSSRTKWERGVVRYDRTTKRVEDLLKDERIYSAVRFSRDGRTAVLSIGPGNRPGDLHAADADFKNVRRLTNANPHLAQRRLGRTELLSYLDVDGHAKYGVVHYPPDYSAGTRYPTVFIIYEDFFDDTFDPVANLLNAGGYVVVKPSVDFDIGYPGEAWVKGVTSAANKLIETGVADSARLGVHGTSYGGYATNLLITQTPRFKAAINIAGKVDVISFYTDSPRLGVRNVHAAEKSQDRIGATLWQQPQKYVAHSAIFFADRIKTPLLLMTGEQDHNVPAINTREMYYALRRLGKEVHWVHYMHGGHGVPMNSLRDFTDFHQRIVRWYDEKLKGPSKREAADGGAR